MLRISPDKICWLLITCPSIHLSAVCIICPPKTNLTAPQPPISVSQTSTYLPVLPSFPGSADSSISPFSLSVCLSVQLSVLPWLCWQLLGLMPSQCSAPSWPLERRLHSLSRWTGNHSFSHFFFSSNFLSSQKFILPVPHLQQLSVSLFLSSVSISIPLHGWPSCCWEADRKRDWERQADRKHTIPWRALLRKSASQAQSVFSPPLHVPHAVPVPRLHACL